VIHAYRWLVAWLVWLSADPAAVDLERPRAAAAVAAARASMTPDAPPAPPPTPPAPTPATCCSECGGKGYIVMPDGHRVACPCPPTCRCKAAKAVPAALPTPGSPAVP
jgi:hypothetical protein